MPAVVWRQSQLDLTPPSPWIDRSRVSMVGKVFFSLPHLSTNARVDDCTLHKTLSSSGVIFVERGGTSKFVPFFSALTLLSLFLKCCWQARRRQARWETP